MRFSLPAFLANKKGMGLLQVSIPHNVWISTNSFAQSYVMHRNKTKKVPKRCHYTIWLLFDTYNLKQRTLTAAALSLRAQPQPVDRLWTYTACPSPDHRFLHKYQLQIYPSTRYCTMSTVHPYILYIFFLLLFK